MAFVREFIGVRASSSQASAQKEKNDMANHKTSSWLDPKSDTPLIEEQARRLNTFVEALADGRVDKGEVAAQEARLVAAMKEVEPLLEPALHEKVTKLLCELTAYDLMNVLHVMGTSRPKTKFRG
jgi:hypothetical protein